MRLLVSCLLVSLVDGRKGFGPTEQEWGYVTVRDKAHMFWWLQHTSANVGHYTERPLVIWLQGGPGASSTGYGNFAELGPLDINLEARNTTWINDFNVLFVDNPVGTGFSHVDSLEALPTTNIQIAEDFVVLLRGVYDAVPELTSVPLYIFSESYGGKMAVDIALLTDKAIKEGLLDITLAGIGLGDAWISPIESVRSWAPFLLSMGAVDENGCEQIEEIAEAATAAVNESRYLDAAEFWAATERLIMNLTEDIDFYNILTKVPSTRHFQREKIIFKPSVHATADQKIEKIMNNQVKNALGLEVVWGKQSGGVFKTLFSDFMRSVTEQVELLLNTTDIKIAVYNGQLDLIVDTPGTVKWVDELKFEGAEKWKEAPRRPIVVEKIVEGYYKKVGNLAMYWINRAGHMVPTDNPQAMNYILQDISENLEESWEGKMY